MAPFGPFRRRTEASNATTTIPIVPTSKQHQAPSLDSPVTTRKPSRTATLSLSNARSLSKNQQINSCQPDGFRLIPRNKKTSPMVLLDKDTVAITSSTKRSETVSNRFYALTASIDDEWLQQNIATADEASITTIETTGTESTADASIAVTPTRKNIRANAKARKTKPTRSTNAQRIKKITPVVPLPIPPVLAIDVDVSPATWESLTQSSRPPKTIKKKSKQSTRQNSTNDKNRNTSNASSIISQQPPPALANASAWPTLPAAASIPGNHQRQSTSRHKQ